MNVKTIFGYITVASFIMIIALSFGIILWAFNQDYIIYELGSQAETMKNNSLITNQSYNSIESAGNFHAGLSLYFDWWYIGTYIAFFLGSIIVAYFSREEGYGSFLTNLFFGIMVMLFIISILNTITDWWINDILYNLIPNLDNTLPMFDHQTSNIGIYSFIQMLLCLLANRLYFPIQNFINKKDSLKDSDEVL